jgi:arylsulfatase A-like enzyme
VDRPNIILITIDSLRADRVGWHGHGRSATPNLDRLAASSLQFTQAMTGGSWTQAAFPVLMTSSYASMYGGCLGRLSPERPALIEALATHGYTTAGFSTSPHLSRATGYDRGFDYFEDLLPAEADPHLRSVSGGQRLLRHPLTHRVALALGQSWRPARVYSSAVEVTDRVCDWLAQARAPVFTWAHYMDVHWPYHIEETLVEPGSIARAWQDLALMHQRANFRRKKALSDNQCERFGALYERALEHVDREIGRLLDFLSARDLDRNTVVVVTADHGEEFMDHGRWGHWESNLFDEILHVPLVVRLPGRADAVRIDRLVRLLDLMPTILAIAGCPPVEAVEGVSLAPLWEAGERQYDVRESISEMQRGQWHRIAVRSERYKYIWDSQSLDKPALYDLIADPGEKQSIAAQHPLETGHFQHIVNRHRAHIAATQPAIAPADLEHEADVVRRLQALGYLD